MKKPGPLYLVAIGFLSLICTVSSSWAQSGRRIHYSTLYNPGTVETVRGEVINLGKTLSGNGRDYCLNLTMRTAQEKILVILEPASYAGKLPIGIKAGDQVEVKGSRITIMGLLVHSSPLFQKWRYPRCAPPLLREGAHSR